MYKSITKTRVRYSETDQMGYVYYGNYAMYYEIGRVEALRQLGLSYKTMEENGILLPVSTLEIQYIKPIFYDEELTIKTIITERPSVRIHFNYEIYDSAHILCNKASTTLVFVNKKTGKPTVAPHYFSEKMNTYFD